ncbi:Dystrophin, isoform E [Amphibalanus amphitrite]|uniref:Protein detached n=1 Tax=Amphibalanus amphitrite TaxID=1232801 RepID=A0A6A4VV50_AMPAM|nr:Dystrophin, isoform E [Amphibalanus amphitrite]
MEAAQSFLDLVRSREDALRDVVADQSLTPDRQEHRPDGTEDGPGPTTGEVLRRWLQLLGDASRRHADLQSALAFMFPGAAGVAAAGGSRGARCERLQSRRRVASAAMWCRSVEPAGHRRRLSVPCEPSWTVSRAQLPLYRPASPRLQRRRSVDVFWLTEKMHVLERCMQDVERRLTELEQAPSSSDVIDDVTEGTDRLLAVQRGLDDVNEQVARLTENGAPLSSERLARLSTLATRLRQLSSASCGALTGCELSRSVEPPWERAETAERVPYYLHHGERRTQWSHPRLTQLTASLSQLDSVRFSAYRTALKLRRLQRALLLHRLPLEEAALAFQTEAWRLPCSGVAAVPDVLAVLTELYGRLQPPLSGGAALALRVDLCLNWLISVYDSRRTGSIPVYCLKLAIITLCQARLEDKYRYMFQLSADGGGQLDSRRLARLLRRLLQLPGQLAEAAAFGPDQVAGSVSSCLESAGGAAGLTELQLLDWLRAEPQSVVWLPVLHRVAGAETARHQARCNVCKEYPIVGFRYRCLKCFNWDMCQQCFFTGRVSKGHKLSHPLHEYCTESSSSDGLRDLAKSIRNRFKSKHHFRKHQKLAYLPVQHIEEADTDAADSTDPANTTDTLSPDEGGGHSELANNSSVFSSPDSEEELQMITQYCLGLWPAGSDCTDTEGESAAPEEHLRAVVRHLEQERSALQAEYRRLTAAAPVGVSLAAAEESRPNTPDWSEDGDDQLRAQVQQLDRDNRQLGQQLSQLRRLIEGGGTNLARSSTLQTRAVTAAYLSSEGPEQQPASPAGRLSRAKRLALSLARRNGHTVEIAA